ncbi:hypothetical protein SAMN05421678_111114 [Actinopolymorpha cephalotaxi]|uniref:DUF6458 domain-containing protein n=1 Tax=Actinopolymorpha cephalotaxi TaxID=504797 RepID=A0A1I2WX32_9ACTN|nr:DUF6458 family protein [Actinopolymorpha cephalotaxi]NYH85143.1 hypothetical protein [Actinopolymorpha cephalotaxi]SFH05169.1 hypothetical protein SAMN05421678_111114 [Actinopolymorpha cephalotaxi]
MGIGVSLLLATVGAILAFAVDYRLAGVDVTLIGWILMTAGALGVVATLAIWMPGRARNVPVTRGSSARRGHVTGTYHSGR